MSAHRMLRAFTLIELLVVIAIIAILAAILFPVFAQAKAAAKSAASLSNAYQLGLASTMYSGDYDDTVELSGAWDTGHDVGSPGGPDTVSTWGWLLLPYTKSADITQDPQTTGNGNLLVGASDQTNKLFFSQYGINYVYLTPYDLTRQVQVPVTADQVDHPSNTIMFASKYGYLDTMIGTNGYPIIDTVGAPAMWTTVEVPDCQTYAVANPNLLCVTNWGAQDGYINDPTQIGVSTAAGGSNTGGVSLRNAGMAVVEFMDTHAKKMTAGQLAGGTNWTPTIQASNVLTVDPTKYLWSTQ